jgi:hypothetical protein
VLVLEIGSGRLLASAQLGRALPAELLLLRNISIPVLDRMDNNLLKLHICPNRRKENYRGRTATGVSIT